MCAGFIQKFVSQVLLTFEFQANVPGSALCERTAFSSREERLKIIKISCRPRSRLSLGPFVCAKSKACPRQATADGFLAAVRDLHEQTNECVACEPNMV